MLEITFSGWIQVRLATDPDPFDEPRGVSGYVRTLPGEPDFDRLIRLHNPVAPRTHAPPTGVFTTSAQVSGSETIAELRGAKVNLLEEPKFEGRNGIVAEDVLEPILPFHLSIEANAFYISRSLGGNYSHPYRPLWGKGTRFGPEDWKRRIQTDDPTQYLRSRREKLISECAEEAAPLARAQFTQRIDFLSAAGHAGRFAWGMEWRYDLAGDPHWIDNSGVLPVKPDNSVPWRTVFRIGIWDADALSAWMEGSLLIPLLPRLIKR